MQPQIAPLLDDPVTGSSRSDAMLIAAGLVALQRYNVVTSRTLLRFGMVFEVAVAFSIAMVETRARSIRRMPLLGAFGGRPVGRVVGCRDSEPAEREARPRARGGHDMASRLRDQCDALRIRHRVVAPRVDLAGDELSARHRRVRRGTLDVRHRARGADSARTSAAIALLSPIGEGGMGEVWRASHKMLARPGGHQAREARRRAGRRLFAQRFHREANMIAGLQSPHTVYLYDFGTTQDGRFYYVMELLDGISLQTLVTTFGPQPASRVVAILQADVPLARGSAPAEIVHRDLKPSNVMICKVAQVHDFVKVLDFGLAKPFGAGGASTHLTVEGVTLGTPEYMAPEVARGEPHVDARADLYALGCVAYVLLTGTLVFTDSNPVERGAQTHEDAAGSAVAADRAMSFRPISSA